MGQKIKTGGVIRNSSIELFRIITMLCIVAHHYVVNSGIMVEITRENVLTGNSIFVLIFGWGGKTGINCFVLITGYFMCRSNISLKKFLKLFLEIEFYNIVFYTVFLITGYEDFSLKAMVKALLPIYSLGTGFTSSYLVFYLFIPFLNLLVGAMDEKTKQRMVLLGFLFGTKITKFLKSTSAFNYVSWFMVLYFMAAYIRIYPKRIFGNGKVWGRAALASLLLSWCSVVFGCVAYHQWGLRVYHYFVSDSYKILAAVTAVCGFLYFKNLNIKTSSIINGIAASTFGVLLIHANSDTMRKWLWRDTLDNVRAFKSSRFAVHAIVSVTGVYIICTLIDMVRIQILERAFFKWCSKSVISVKLK